jgi:hypothetical protein
MAVFNRIKRPQEDMFDELILAKILVPVEDLSEEITVLAMVRNDECGIFVLDDVMEGDDVGVSGGELVETDLVQV